MNIETAEDSKWETAFCSDWNGLHGSFIDGNGNVI
jgi:hypothetical protein